MEGCAATRLLVAAIRAADGPVVGATLLSAGLLFRKQDDPAGGAGAAAGRSVLDVGVVGVVLRRPQRVVRRRREAPEWRFEDTCPILAIYSVL